MAGVTAPARGSADHRFVYFGMPDAHGALRGKVLAGREFQAARDRGFMPLGDLMLAVDPVDALIETLEGVGTQYGFRDLLLRPEIETLRELPGRPGWGICIGTPLWPDGEVCELGTRVAAQRVLKHLDELGFALRASHEYEFRVWEAQTGEPANGPLSYHLGEAMRLRSLLEAIEDGLQTLGIDLRVSHPEGAPGLVEINIDPADGVLAADNAMVLKEFVKSLGTDMGLRVSFLAKPVVGEEGSSGHFHVSLRRKAGGSAFAAPGDDPQALPAELRHAIGGLLDHMPAVTLLHNPTINSYKRLRPDFFVPVHAIWGIDNRWRRSGSFSGERASRLELRRPGADANPYLVLAGTAAAIASGIERGVAPPAPTVGDPAATSGKPPPVLPSTLEQAVGAFRADTRLRDMLGEGFSEYFARTREWELRAWQQAVTEWERERYAQI